MSKADLPTGKFDDACVIENFVEAAETTAAVLDLELPLGTRVCLTVLKKLYERRGSGRKENALHRGLDHHGRRMVPDVLRLLQTEGLVFPADRPSLLQKEIRSGDVDRTGLRAWGEAGRDKQDDSSRSAERREDYGHIADTAQDP